MRRAIEADIAVFGAGAAGCIAAIAAARQGARTILLDRLGFPGGTSTAVLDTFYAFFTAGESSRKVVSGLPDEPVQRLRERGCLVERPNTFGSGLGYTYDPETLKIVWAELLREAGVHVMLHTLLFGTGEPDPSAVASATVATRGGPFDVKAGVYIDATGDADLVRHAGGRFQPDVDTLQPATLTFRMTDVDFDEFRDKGRPRFRELVNAGRVEGWRLDGNGGSLHRSASNGVVLVSVTRLAAPDLDDPFEPGRLELQGLDQIDEWTKFLRRSMPGFERSTLVAIGAMSGVRETRRIVGRYTLTESDVVSGRHFPDDIARCGAPVEDLSGPDTRWRHVEGGGDYGIPWTSLLPQQFANVVVAGRCLSATHSAHASARSMGTCMAMGQAAGTAAAMAIAKGADVSAISVPELQAQLRLAGADIAQMSSEEIKQ